MFSKKAAIFLVIALLGGLQIKNIYIIEDFDNPIFYKAIYILSHSIHKVSQILADYLNYGLECSNFRYLLNELNEFTRSLSTIENTNILNTRINNVKVRIYTPKVSSSKNLPILVYYHGGAFVFGSLSTYDIYLSELSSRLNLIAVSVDYKLAPEHPFPTPTNDCYSVTKFIIENANSFDFNGLKGDADKVILAGDSSGGNAVAVLTQRFAVEKIKMPKLQVLIYPWTQLFNLRLPSAIEYAKKGSFTGFSFGQYVSWYLGINKVSKELEDNLNFNNHTDLIENQNLKKNIIDYLDLDLIPSKYKVGHSYYNRYKNFEKEIYPTINSDNILKKDKKIAEILANAFTTQVSPGLAKPENLVGLPKSYFIICEWDSIKDEGLIYSERLRRAGVPVEVAFYEKGFHGIVSFVDKERGFKVAHDMLNDLVNYLKKNL